MSKVLITGCAGFIGFHVAKRLLDKGHRVIGVDCISDYYDVSLKHARLDQLKVYPEFRFVFGKIETRQLLMNTFNDEHPDFVVHLAAQAGVRYSIDNPRSYLESNIIGTFELLEAARTYPPTHMLLASTSSVYGANSKMPYHETDRSDHQVSFYAATKKSTESMAHSYSHLFGLPITMFRFFTVYGQWGRPDMAPHKFVNAILSGNPIDVYNYGEMTRDFTYVDDLVSSISSLLNKAPSVAIDDLDKQWDSMSPVAPWRTINIGNSKPITLNEFIRAIERATGKNAVRNLMPMQAGDVKDTWADTKLLEKLIGCHPSTNIDKGMMDFVSWFKSYY